tara:strand:- start:1867 stop:2208 length:342 start_codon:yes stop_codon:yes gene_type:complete
MNLFLALLLTTSIWLTFSALNELRSAKDGQGCCLTKDCGQSMLDKGVWWGNLVIGVVFTIYILYEIYQRYGHHAHAALRKGKEMHATYVSPRFPGRGRAAPPPTATQMVFGYY